MVEADSFTTIDCTPIWRRSSLSCFGSFFFCFLGLRSESLDSAGLLGEASCRFLRLFVLFTYLGVSPIGIYTKLGFPNYDMFTLLACCEDSVARLFTLDWVYSPFVLIFLYCSWANELIEEGVLSFLVRGPEFALSQIGTSRMAGRGYGFLRHDGRLSITDCLICIGLISGACL